MRTTVLLALALGAQLFANAAWAGDSMIDRRLREAIAAMAANPVPGAPPPLERGARLLLSEGAMEDQAEVVTKAFGDAFALLGRPQAVEEVAVRAYGTRSEVAYFVLPCERGAAFVRVVSLKRGDNNRVVSSVSVATVPELVFPPALLEPEPPRR